MNPDAPFACTAVGSTDLRPLDYGQAGRALALFADPDAGMHLQSRPRRRHAVAPGGDADAMLAAVRSLDEGDSVYFGLNPCPAGLVPSPGVKVGDILRRRWLLIDADPPKGDAGDRSATDEEKAAAAAALEAAVAYLAGHGFPAPVLIDSGNGCYAAYRVDLPCDRLSQVVLGKLLKAVAAQSDRDGAAIDTGVHAANQRAKLPGSWARKGPDTPERPHRQARLVGVPDVVEVVPFRLLRLAAWLPESEGETPPAPAPAPNGPAPPFAVRATGGGDPGAAWARRALEGECGKVALTRQPGRQKQLWDSACALGEVVGAGLLSEGEVTSALTQAAHSCGLHEDSSVGERGIADTIKRGMAQGKTQPRQAPERRKDPRPSASAGIPEVDRIIVRASSVTPRRVDFLWPGRIPLGKMTTFAGVGGIGKTFVLCDIAARVTGGLAWPDGDGESPEPGQVLFLSGEDDPDDTLVPRLIECGADLDRVCFLRADVQDRFTLADLDTLDRALRETGAGVRFVVMDPPTSFLAGVDDHKNAELRSLLSPLKTWTAKHRLSLVFNTHVNKGTAGKVEAMMRVMGSVAWVNAVRAAHMFARDPEDIDRVFFVPMKMNNAAMKKGLAYRIAPLADSRAKVEWLGDVDLSADEAVSQAGKQPRKVLARDWLVDLFRQKLEWPAEEFWASARQHGVTKNAIDEARVRLAMPKPRRTVGPSGNVAWTWWVPPDWPHLPKAAPDAG
jgi:hypothetical protein